MLLKQQASPLCINNDSIKMLQKSDFNGIIGDSYILKEQRVATVEIKSLSTPKSLRIITGWKNSNQIAVHSFNTFPQK